MIYDASRELNTDAAQDKATSATSNPSNNPPRDSSMRSMPPKVGRGRYGRNSAPRFRGNSVYLLAASDGRGVTANTLAKTTPEYVGRIAHLIDAAAAVGDLEFIERTLAPIDAARQRIAAPALTPELIEACQAADLAEDLAEVRCLACMTLPKKRAWLEKVRAERGQLLFLELALVNSIAGETER